MPGIAGIISKRLGNAQEQDLRIMLNCMVHEPFYNSGIYVNHQLGLYVGWTCHRDSFADCMPVFNENKDVVLIFSGENFGDKETGQNLKGRGHEFDPLNATVLIHLYEEEGEDFLKRLNGWFNGLLVDTQQGKTILFNDRFGMQRIYYHESQDEFVFASEAKALLSIRPHLRVIDFKGLGEYLTCGCVLQNRSLFSNIFLLPGGAAWKFQDSACAKKDHYFNPESWENQFFLERETFYEQFKETFQEVMPSYLEPDGSVGISLTGGLDTRMLMACVDRAPGSMPCYTFGGMYRDSFDVSVSREVAQACRQKHYVLQLGREFLVNYPRLAEKSVYISDGCLDACSAYELYLNKLARGIAPIRLTGNYGSEVLRNVRAFKAIPPGDGLLDPDFSVHTREAVKTFAEISKGHRLSFAVFRQAPWYGYGRLSVEQSQLTLRTPYMDNAVVALAYQAPEGATATREISLRLIADCNPALSKILTDRGFGHASNFSSIASRIYREFLFRSDYYYNHGMPHWLAKIDTTLSPLHLEKLLLGHHKFHHYRIWFRRELAEYMTDMLSDERTASRPHVKNPATLKKMVNDHMRGVRNCTSEINMMLSVELIYRLLIEQ